MYVLDRCCLRDIWIQREWIWIGQDQIWERKRKTYLLTMTRIFKQHCNILESFIFCTRKHIEVGLNFSLAAGPKMLCLCFIFFSTGQVIGNTWAVPEDRQTNTQLPEVSFLCFYVSNFAYMNQVKDRQLTTQPPSTHFQLFGGRQYTVKKNFPPPMTQPFN